MSATQRKFARYVKALGPDFQGRVSEREGMKKHTTFKIGGMAEVMLWPKRLSDLAAAIELADKMELDWRVLGAGSNLLVGDGGLEEVAIVLDEEFETGAGEAGRPSGAMVWEEGEIPPGKKEPAAGPGERRVRLNAGLRLAKAIKFCQAHGLSGLEFGAGIPGSVGGAAVMNAGSLGSTMSEVVEWVEWFQPGAGLKRTARRDLDYGYRKLARPRNAIVLACGVKLKTDEPRAIRERIVKGLKWRRQNQPLAYPSAGSVFKNPPGDYAGRLIEAAGLKGERMGDAQISDLHANFIVNRGRARSREVMALIDKAREEVKKRFKTELELEIEVIGKELP